MYPLLLTGEGWGQQQGLVFFLKLNLSTWLKGGCHMQGGGVLSVYPLTRGFKLDVVYHQQRGWVTLSPWLSALVCRDYHLLDLDLEIMHLHIIQPEWTIKFYSFRWGIFFFTHQFIKRCWYRAANLRFVQNNNIVARSHSSRISNFTNFNYFILHKSIISISSSLKNVQFVI